MYKNEILFTQRFLITLKKLGISNIPYCDSKYRKGVREMKKYFRHQKDKKPN